MGRDVGTRRALLLRLDAARSSYRDRAEGGTRPNDDDGFTRWDAIVVARRAAAAAADWALLIVVGRWGQWSGWITNHRESVMMMDELVVIVCVTWRSPHA